MICLCAAGNSCVSLCDGKLAWWLQALWQAQAAVVVRAHS